MIHNFRKLTIYSLSMELSSEVISICRDFPVTYRYNLTSQIIRSAISIPSNIAEGASRSSNKDFTKFVEYAIGSAYELETQLQIASGAKLIDKDLLKEIIDNLQRLQKMMTNFKHYLS